MELINKKVSHSTYSHRKIQVGKIQGPNKTKGLPTASPSKYPTTGPTTLPTTLPTQAPTQAPSHYPSNFPTVLPTHFPSTAPSDPNYKNNKSKQNPSPVSSPITNPSQDKAKEKTDKPTYAPKAVRVIVLPTYELSYEFDTYIGTTINYSHMYEITKLVNKHYKEIASTDFKFNGDSRYSGISFLTEAEPWGTEGIGRERILQLDGFGDTVDNELSDTHLAHHNKIMHYRFKTTCVLTQRVITEDNVDDDTFDVSDDAIRQSIQDMIESYYTKSDQAYVMSLEEAIPDFSNNLQQVKFYRFSKESSIMSKSVNGVDSKQISDNNSGNGEIQASQYVYGCGGFLLAIFVCLLIRMIKRGKPRMEKHSAKMEENKNEMDDERSKHKPIRTVFRKLFKGKQNENENKAYDRQIQYQREQNLSYDQGNNPYSCNAISETKIDNSGMCNAMNCVVEEKESNEMHKHESRGCFTDLCLG